MLGIGNIIMNKNEEELIRRNMCKYTGGLCALVFLEKWVEKQDSVDKQQILDMILHMEESAKYFLFDETCKFCPKLDG